MVYMWCVAQFGTILQFKKREKHPWRNVDFRKVAGFKPATLLKLSLLHGCFSGFLNCTNGTKLRNASHIIKSNRMCYLVYVPQKQLSTAKRYEKRVAGEYLNESKNHLQWLWFEAVTSVNSTTDSFLGNVQGFPLDD